MKNKEPEMKKNESQDAEMKNQEQKNENQDPEMKTKIQK